MKKLLKLISLATISVLIFTACEGPMGPMGSRGEQGPRGERGERGINGKDATCNLCHFSSSVQAIVYDYDNFSLHAYGTAYASAGARAECAPCHSNKGFHYVVNENKPANFIGNANQFTVDVSAYLRNPDPISCKTCHAGYHTEDYDWFDLTTVAPVPMTMWGSAKTITFTGNAASSNLCAKCHQPRPITGTTGPINYDLLVSNPVDTYGQSTLSYRTGIHYSSQAALYAGTGGIEFGDWGSRPSSWHVTRVSCARCHMAETDSRYTEGHTFVATLKGCVVSCHQNNESALNDRMVTQQAELDQLISNLADKINAIGGGNNIIESDGYFNIYDAGSNPTGYWRNPAHGTPALPSLTNAHVGAIINYQLVVRSSGAAYHNYPYVKKLLETSIAVI